MMIMREHIEEDNRTMTVLNIVEGDAVSFTSKNYNNYDDLVEEITSIIANGGSFEDIELLFNDDGNIQLRERYGIVLEDDKLVIYREDKVIVLPVGIGSIFKDVTDEEQLQRFIKFAELLDENPYEHAKESLVDWVMKNPSLKILEDGRIQGYRGVTDNMMSKRSGYGIVNGVEVDGQLDNSPGNILEFPRGMIDHNPDNHCSVGLHVGTLDYAHSWGERYVTIAFSPADVVSTVTDSQQHKIRVCEMEILKEITNMEQFRKDVS